jgi:acetamidase/formamidase
MRGEQTVETIWTQQKSADTEADKTVIHELIGNPNNVHWGYFSAAIQPAITVNSGDIVVIEDVPRVDPEIVERSGVIDPGKITTNHRAIYRDVKDRGPGPHIMVGPVYVNSAEPGDVLEVRILDVRLAYSYGYNTQRPYQGTLPEEFPRYWQRIIAIDQERQTAEVARNVVIPLQPFFGTMGVAPHASMGRIGTVLPGVHTGNIDNKDLGPNTILYMPIHVRGALFSAGDGHAAQGHGEVDSTAIETGLRGRFQLLVRKDLHLKWPRAETHSHWVVMGLHEDLEQAMKLAVHETVDFIVSRFPHLTPEESYMIASVAVDYYVTQVVDGRKGVHGMIPKSIFV